MNAVTAVMRPDYVRTTCSTCKPGPDGTWTGVGWTLIIVGAAVAVLGLCMLWFASRADGGAEPAVGSPPTVMDEAQRQDYERRVAQDAQAAQDEQDEQDEQAATSRGTASGSVIALGLGAGLIGLAILGISASRVEDDKGQLRMAAANVLTTAVDGPSICRESAAVESQMWSSTGSSQFLPSAANCGTSPRDYAQQPEPRSPAGVFIPVEYVFSSSFTANGEVTVHDKQDNRSMCVTVPDTDVADAEADAAQPSASPSTLPLLDDVSVDPSPYIRDGACPDAPVSSPNPR